MGGDWVASHRACCLPARPAACLFRADDGDEQEEERGGVGRHGQGGWASVGAVAAAEAEDAGAGFFDWANDSAMQALLDQVGGWMGASWTRWEGGCQLGDGASGAHGAVAWGGVRCGVDSLYLAATGPLHRHPFGLHRHP